MCIMNAPIAQERTNQDDGHKNATDGKKNGTKMVRYKMRIITITNTNLQIIL